MQTAKPPEYPDPKVTAQAQADSNKQTAVAQQNLNMVNQVTPTGNLSYKQTGTASDGTPTYTATTTLTPQLQGAVTNLSRGANALSANAAQTAATPFSLDNAETENRLMQLGRSRMDPMWDQRRGSLETKLYNQGLQPGTEGWTRAMGELGQQENDAYNQLLLTGRQQAVNERITERQEPLNELSAMLSGTQVSPSITQTPTSGVAPTDYLGQVQAKYQSDYNAYQAKLQQQQAMMSGIFGLGKTLLGGIMSDARLKTGVRLIARLANGLGIYSWRWADSGRRELGFIAQEVAHRRSAAVIQGADGYLRVDYAMAGA